MITGNSPDDTVIICHGFRAVLIWVKSVTISNITFTGCGGNIDNLVNDPSRFSFIYLGQGSRLVFLFYLVS